MQELTSKNIELLIKASSTLGLLIVVLYSMRIGYLPTGVSFSDVLFLLVIALSFGLLYSITIGSIFFLGAPLEYIICKLTSNSFCDNDSKNQNNIVSNAITTKINNGVDKLLTVIIYVFAAIWILLLANASSPLPEIKGLGLIFFFFVATFFGYFIRSSYNQYATFNRDLKKLTQRKQRLQKANMLARYKNMRVSAVQSQLTDIKKRLSNNKKSLLLLIFFSPIVISGAFEFMLDAAMRLANIRIDDPSALIYINDDYAKLIPAEATRNDLSPQRSGYQAFQNIKILFTGIGSSSYVSYKSSKSVFSLAIPNDKIIIIRQSSPLAIQDSQK